MRMNIIYEDKHIIVCIKEPGIPVQSDKSRDKDMVNMLRNYVIESEYGYVKEKGIPFIGLVHRLDRPVGGIMVFAKTQTALSKLNKQLMQGQINKYYLALFIDETNEMNTNDEWVCLENYLLKDGKKNISKVVKEGTGNSKKAILYYRILNQINNIVMAEIKLITGRHHQIRVQMAEHDMPLIGDTKYNMKCDSGQVMLYSYKLEFNHPVTKKNMRFEYKPTHGEFNLF